MGRPLLLAATALSWVLLAGVCGVQYLAGKELMPVSCQSTVVLQPAAVVGAAVAAAAAERQEAADLAQQEQPAPGKRQPTTSGVEPQQALGELHTQRAAAPSARGAGSGGGGSRSSAGAADADREGGSTSGDSSSSGAPGSNADTPNGSSGASARASQRLPASWRDVDALIQAASPLHGLQQKGGLPNRCGLAMPASGLGGRAALGCCSLPCGVAAPPLVPELPLC